MPQKVEAYQHTLTRLQDAVACCQRAPEDPLYRDGLIQRFEFTFELAWKSLKEYMEDQGADLSGIAFSKQVFRTAYAAGLIHDQQVWLDMLASRNVTSHVYDDAQAAQVAADICGRYIAPLTALADLYRNA